MTTTEEERMMMCWGDAPWAVLHKEGDGGRRWTEGTLTVVQHRETKEIWGVRWERGLTEGQENSYDSEPFRMESYEETIPAKVVTRYRELKTPQ